MTVTQAVAAKALAAFAIVLSLGGSLVACSPEPEATTGLSASERERHVQYLAQMAEFYAIEAPPIVEVERWVLPEEVTASVDSCLLDLGFRRLPDTTWEVPEEQWAAFQRESYVCTARYPPMPKYTGEWTERQISIQFDWTVDEVIPCLEARGFNIRDVPSRQVFLDSYLSDPFYPFSQVPISLTNEERYGLETECPQIAPSPMLFGEMEVE
ncbi:hypothetical protein [Agromyces sp. NPDC058126]|uniref:hypothetical protein n=1 Tax=Agromyces sp. NPDC058126 TaxID=3346350 RepID=UPI0036D95D72